MILSVLFPKEDTGWKISAKNAMMQWLVFKFVPIKNLGKGMILSVLFPKEDTGWKISAKNAMMQWLVIMASK